jgi:hypothetical protein
VICQLRPAARAREIRYWLRSRLRTSLHGSFLGQPQAGLCWPAAGDHKAPSALPRGAPAGLPPGHPAALTLASGPDGRTGERARRAPPGRPAAGGRAGDAHRDGHLPHRGGRGLAVRRRGRFPARPERACRGCRPDPGWCPRPAAAAAGARWLAEPAPAGSLVRPGGYDGSRAEETKRAAAADVAAVRENDRFVSPDMSGRRDNDLEPNSGR